MIIPRGVLPLCFGILACSPRSSAVTTPAPSATGLAPLAAGPGTQGPSAPPSSSAPTAVHQIAPPAQALVNLLLHTDAHVTLSSRVDNPRDYPEHLLDGKPGTAWNSKTSDTHAWIELELDPRVHVDAIELTAGFDKGDLFEKNLRIAQVRVERDGLLVRDVELDTSVRALQRIPIDGPGGKYRLTVQRTKPGTNPAWREVVVSELVVLGTAPPALLRADATLPRMTVAQGSASAPLPADLQEVKFEGREGAGGLATICAPWKTEVLAVVRKMQKAGQGLDGFDPAWLKCTAAAAPPLENGPLPLGWSVLSAVALQHFNGVVLRDDRYLLLRRPDGATVVGPMYSTSNDMGDSPSPSAWRVGVGVSKGVPVLLVGSVAAWHSPYDHDPDPDSLQAEYEGRVCRFELTRVTCDQSEPTRFAKKTLAKAVAAAFTASPRAELPPIDPATGTLVP